jgi:hypothetical protein
MPKKSLAIEIADSIGARRTKPLHEEAGYIPASYYFEILSKIILDSRGGFIHPTIPTVDIKLKHNMIEQKSSADFSELFREPQLL